MFVVIMAIFDLHRGMGMVAIVFVNTADIVMVAVVLMMNANRYPFRTHIHVLSKGQW